MPMRDVEDHPDGDTSKDYCTNCGTSDSIYSYDKLLENMVNFIKTTGDMNEEEAMKKAKGVIDNSKAVQNGAVKK